MSMIMTLKQAPARTIDLLVARPELAIVFWMDPDYTPPQQPALVRWLARMLGGYTPPMELPEAPPELEQGGREFSVEKAWHGLHWLLTRPELAEGDAGWETSTPAGFLLTAGRPIEGSDHGYGDDRAASPADVSRFNEVLQATPAEALLSRYDGEAMSVAGVYPDVWDDPDEAEWLSDSYADLRDFIDDASANARGVVIQLS